jgi:hypothetical protein
LTYLSGIALFLRIHSCLDISFVDLTGGFEKLAQLRRILKLQVACRQLSQVGVIMHSQLNATKVGDTADLRIECGQAFGFSLDRRLGESLTSNSSPRLKQMSSNIFNGLSTFSHGLAGQLKELFQAAAIFFRSGRQGLR